MNQELVNAICKQINMEFYSAYLYYSMSSWAESEGWKGFAKWLKVQHQEENIHGDLLFRHLMDRGARVILEQIDKPPSEWESPQAVFEEVCEHEAMVTESLNNLATLAMKHNDHTFYQFIQIFLHEQIEEEGTSGDILARVKRLKGHAHLLDAIDIELGSRTFTHPFPELA